MSAIRPGEHLVLGEDIVIVNGAGGVVCHVLIDIVAQHHVQRRFHGLNPQLTQYLLQGVGIQPVVGVHDLIIEPGGMPKPLIHALAMTAVGLMDGANDVRVLPGISVTDGRGVVLGGAVVHQYDLNVLAAGQQRVHAFFHIGGAVIAGHRKSNQFQVIAPFRTALCAWI